MRIPALLWLMEVNGVGVEPGIEGVGVLYYADGGEQGLRSCKSRW